MLFQELRKQQPDKCSALNGQLYHFEFITGMYKDEFFEAVAQAVSGNWDTYIRIDKLRKLDKSTHELVSDLVRATI